jgi:hypothetical protein
MATSQTSSDVAEINIDVPCASCGYNLRGLAGDGRCPECGASVARSLETHLNPIAPAQVLWARTVLAGLIMWLVLIPACVCVVLSMGTRFGWALFAWLNYPGPKQWAVPMAFWQAENIINATPFSFLPVILPILGVMASFLITTPRPRRGEPEALLSLRRWARWTTVVMGGGLLGASLGVGVFNYDTRDVVMLVGFAIVTVELPCTVLLYHYLANIAQRLELMETAVQIRICGWIAGALILASASMLLLRQDLLLIGSIPLVLAGMWLAGAIAVGTAIVACGNLLRLAMALWPIAMVRLARRHQ